MDLGRIICLREGLMALLERIPLLGIRIELVDVLFIFRNDRRCLHDLLADTRVVRVRPLAAAMPVIPVTAPTL